jgi:hypothetical protein
MNGSSWNVKVERGLLKFFNTFQFPLKRDNNNYQFTWMYEGESVNGSQIDIKRKTWYSNLGKKIPWHILHQYWYTCPIALAVRRNPQHRSLLTVVSATSAPPFQPLRHQRNFCHPAVNRFTRQTLPTVYRKHFFMNIFALSPFAHKKSTSERCSLIVHSSSTVTILTIETNLWICAYASAT